MILDCPVPPSLEHVAVPEADKPKDSELIRRMLTPGTGSDFTNISKTPMFVEPVLKALEKQSSVFEVKELGGAAPERREVHIVPKEDTLSEYKPPSVKFQTKSAAEETWTELTRQQLRIISGYRKLNEKSQFLLWCTRYWDLDNKC